MANPTTYTQKVTSVNYSWGDNSSTNSFKLSSAITAQSFGSIAATLIKNVSGFNTNTVLMAQSICADDIDAPIYGNNNIGQQPVSLQPFLGPFMEGGIGGYPFAGTVGLIAWASHIPAVSGALYLNVMPHLGITIDGDVGYVKRRGQGGSLSTTCGAVGLAVNWVLNNNTAPVSSNFVEDFQQWVLTDIVWNSRQYITPVNVPLSAKMIVATKSILNAASAITEVILPNAYSFYFGNSNRTPVFVSYGTFINVDDGYSAYINIDGFKRYDSFGWVDYTSYCRTLTA